MITIFESNGRLLKLGEIDGMEDLLGDDVLPTDWDIAVENPPHVGYTGPLPHPDLPRPTKR